MILEPELLRGWREILFLDAIKPTDYLGCIFEFNYRASRLPFFGRGIELSRHPAGDLLDQATALTLSCNRIRVIFLRQIRMDLWHRVAEFDLLIRAHSSVVSLRLNIDIVVLPCTRVCRGVTLFLENRLLSTTVDAGSSFGRRCIPDDGREHFGELQDLLVVIYNTFDVLLLDVVLIVLA